MTNFSAGYTVLNPGYEVVGARICDNHYSFRHTMKDTNLKATIFDLVHPALQWIISIHIRFSLPVFSDDRLLPPKENAKSFHFRSSSLSCSIVLHYLVL